MKTIAVVLVVVVVVPMDARQGLGLGAWKNFTDMKTIRAVAIGANSVWAATSGGLYSFDTTGKKIRTFTNSDGLSSNDLTALLADAQNRVWTGASDGSIDVYDASSGRWGQIADIRLSSKIQKSVHSFYLHGDSMLVASDVGISVFLISRGEFADTYSNFGLPAQVYVYKVVTQGSRIWAATNQGVATALLTSFNLPSPTSWSIYSTPKGLPSSSVTSVAVFHDTLVAGTPAGAAFYSGDSFRIIPAFSGKSIVDFLPRSDVLLALSNGSGSFSVESISSLNSSSRLVATNGLQASGFAGDPSSVLWVGTSSAGLAKWDGSTWDYVVADGPQSNLCISLAVDDGGTLWVASGSGGGGKGFYRYNSSLAEGVQWKNFTVGKYPIMVSNDYYKVSVGTNGSLWVSSWGFGVVEVKADTIRRRIDALSTPNLTSSVATDPSFVVVGSAAVDLPGKTWFINLGAVNGRYVAQLTNDSTFVYYGNSYSPSEGFFTNMVIDRNGTKWIANSDPAIRHTSGLYYFNEASPLAGTESSGGWGFFSTADGLPDPSVVSLVLDQDGDLWAGTFLGVLIVTDTNFPKSRKTTSFPLREQSIQSIAVDGVNNKWVGTKEGVFVVNSDGTQLVDQYTVASTNGKLLSNDVRSIAIDQKRGVVYFGTEKGISSVQISPVQPSRTFSSLEFGPNPYVIPADVQMVIKNLVANSTIKILSVDGKLVSEFKAQGGGRAFWDGRDQNGRLVSTGVYFVVAFAENGNQITTGKIAVVRR